MLTNTLEKAIKEASILAQEYGDEYITPNHLLLYLIKQREIKQLLNAFNIKIPKISYIINQYFKKKLPEDDNIIKPKAAKSIENIVERVLALNSKITNSEKTIDNLYIISEAIEEPSNFLIKELKIQEINKEKIIAYIAQLDNMNTKRTKLKDNNDIIPARMEKASIVNKKIINNNIRLKEIIIPDKQRIIRDSFLIKNNPNLKTGEHETLSLEEFCVNLNAKALDGNVDCLIGRSAEVQRVIEILCRRRKNNALLVGEPGVGKTAIAEGLAFCIIQGQVPELLKNTVIYALDLGYLVAGTKYRGDFEERIKKMLIELKIRKNIILFIDEIHSIIGAGSSTAGALDASNLLKPAFARGEIRCIGSTTFKEYYNHFEKDLSLVRRFQKIIVDEPNQEMTIKILQGIREYYEKHHNVKYSDDALRAAVTLSERYITERQLPDKAIDLIDESGARKALKNLNSDSKKITVTEQDILEIVSAITNIPNIHGGSNKKSEFSKIENKLKKFIFGQDEAIEILCSSLKLSKTGLRKTTKPIGSYLFLGENGIGKREVAKQLAKASSMKFFEFDMEEYKNAHSVFKLTGAPNHYHATAHNQKYLINEINKYPYSVILFKDISKAHSDVINIIEQIISDGKLTDHHNKPIDFSNTIIVMTNNSLESSNKIPIGFIGKNHHIHNENHKNYDKDTNFLGKEFKNKLDNIIYFKKLNEEMLRASILQSLNELKKNLSMSNIIFLFDKDVINYLAADCIKHKINLNMLEKKIEKEIKKNIADEMLFGKLKDGGKALLKFDSKSNKLVFSFTKKSFDSKLIETI